MNNLNSLIDSFEAIPQGKFKFLRGIGKDRMRRVLQYPTSPFKGEIVGKRVMSRSLVTIGEWRMVMVGKLSFSRMIFGLTKEMYRFFDIDPGTPFESMPAEMPFLLPETEMSVTEECLDLFFQKYRDFYSFPRSFGVRLPTELEWERCLYSNVDDRSLYPWGDSLGVTGSAECTGIGIPFSCQGSPSKVQSYCPIGIGRGWYDFLGLAYELLLDRPIIDGKGLTDWSFYTNMGPNFCATGGGCYLIRGSSAPSAPDLFSRNRRLILNCLAGCTGFRVVIETDLQGAQ